MATRDPLATETPSDTHHTLQIMQGLMGHHRIFDSAVRRIGNGFHGGATLSGSLDVDTWRVGGSTPLGGGHQSTVLAIGHRCTRRAVESSDSKITGVGRP